MSREIASPGTLRAIRVPLLIVALTAVAITALWLQPGARLDSKAPNTVFLVWAGLALLMLWFVLFSGSAIRWRLVVLALGFASVATGVWLMTAGYLVFDGDMVIHLRAPWVRHNEIVAAHRQAQQALPTSEVDLHGDYNWPEFRGPRRDGVVRGPRLARDWNVKPPRLLWKQPCGEGFGSMAIAGNLLVTLEQRGDSEAVVAYDTETGKERWKHEYPARFWEPLGGLGPRATPTIADGFVYSLGAKGHLVCLEAQTGAHHWTVNILENGVNLQWGMAGSPLIVDNKVIVNPGYQGADSPENKAVVAYDRVTGNQVWATPGKRAGYSSPMLATLADHRQIVLFDGGQVAGYEPASGKLLWSYPWNRTREDINVAQPIVWPDGRVFISSGYGVGCALIQVTAQSGNWEVKELWHRPNKPLRCKISSPVEYNGYLYGLDEGILACIDARDGTLKWRDGRYGHGQLLRYEDLLIILDEKGNLVLVEARPDRYHELGKVKAIRSDPRTWNVPAVANGRIYVRNEHEMACYDLRD
jgi:outer membrane protein assembly factor BamB